MNPVFQFQHFLIGLQERAKNNELLKYRLKDHIVHLDDEDDPDFRGWSTGDPLLGIQMLEVDVPDEDVLLSGQYDIKIPVRYSLFCQRSYKDPQQQNIVGADAIMALWQLALNELAGKRDRNNFEGTSFPGKVVEVYLTSVSGSPTRLRNPAHPNLVRMSFTLEYEMDFDPVEV